MEINKDRFRNFKISLLKKWLLRFYLEGELPHFEFGYATPNAHSSTESKRQQSVRMVMTLLWVSFNPSLRCKGFRVREIFVKSTNQLTGIEDLSLVKKQFKFNKKEIRAGYIE